MAPERTPPALSLWASPVLHSQVNTDPDADGPNWVEAYWLSANQALLAYRAAGGLIRWERLDLATGQRHPERAFGDALQPRRFRPYAHSVFDLKAVSPDGQWLLGEDGNRVAALGTHDRRETWTFQADHLDYLEVMAWMPDSRSWVWVGDGKYRDSLLRFHLGEPTPRRYRLRGVPTSDGDGALRCPGVLPTGDVLLFAHPFTDRGTRTYTVDLYAAPLTEGVRARRLPRLRLAIPSVEPGPNLNWRGPQNLILSPRGDRWAFWWDDGAWRSLWVCHRDGSGLREIGRMPAGPPNAFASVVGLAWRPDNRHLSFCGRDNAASVAQLYLARV